MKKEEVSYNLEECIRNVIKEIKDRFSKREIACKPSSFSAEYFDYMSSIFKKYGLIEKRNPDDVGRLSAIFEIHLGIRRKSGIKREYYVMDITPMSEEAKRDIQEYDKLKDGVIEYVKENISSTAEIKRSDIEKLIEKYVSDKIDLKSVDGFLVSRILGVCEAVLNIRYDYEKKIKIGNYYKNEIEEMIKKVKRNL